MKIVAVDLFCGAGGLTHGLRQAGLEVAAGVDLDRHCKYPFEINNESEFIQSDVADLRPELLIERFKGADCTLLAGCAPCQPFSTYSRGKKSVPGDTRWQLLDAFVGLVESVKPDLVTMENVTGLRNHAIFSRFVRRLQAQGFNVNSTILYGPDVGLPQTRKRLVLLASRFGWPRFETADSDGLSTVRDAIQSTPPLEAGQSDPTDVMHRASGLSDLHLRRLRASVPGGTWRDWPEELRAKCHADMARPSYVSVYGRMSWDLPAPTITTQFYGIGHGRFGHPEQDRAITPREGAILQGFPSDYGFVSDEGEFAFNRLGRLIGNAVPVPFGKLIGDSLVTHVKQNA